MKRQQTLLMLIAILLMSVVAATAQTTTKSTTKAKTTKTRKSTPPKAAGAAVTVKLVSKCEKDIMIYAGPKANLRDPKQREIGGLSVNNLYLKTGDVVCIMDAKKKPASCMNVTKSTPTLNINPSGTAIVLP